MENKKKISIDSRIGGNGDIWMRLVGFYAFAALLPNIQIRILIPKFFRTLADHTFGDRLEFIDDNENIKLKYTSKGIIDLFKGFLKGDRYIVPYQRAVINDKKKSEIKDIINILLFSLAQYCKLVHLPAWKNINYYQGYLDIIGHNTFKHIAYDDFVVQQRLDYEVIYHRLQQRLPVSLHLVIPEDLGNNILVYPTGTSRQFIPVTWAKKYLPDAYYAFFFKDAEAIPFEKAGLKTIKFYHEPSDIMELAKNAKWTVSTDSFPSHLLQSGVKNCTITITEVLKSRIIAPSFAGKVIDAEVSCHPCLHLDRKNHPTCVAGFTECQNWKSNKYTQDLLNSVEIFDLINSHE